MGLTPVLINTTATCSTTHHQLRERREIPINYLTRFGRRRTRQSEPIPHADQVPNSAGGYAWAVDDWTRLRRFLILGSEGGSYYAREQELTRPSAVAVARAIAADGPRAVREIVAISRDGRAPKNDPAIFALAMAASADDEATRKLALAALPDVCRTGTHLFAFTRYVEQFRGWGRGLRRGVGAWYVGQSLDRLAYQAVKYRQRDGVTHRDVLRLAHPGAKTRAGNPRLPVTDEHVRLFEWIVRGGATAAPGNGVAAVGEAVRGEAARRAGVAGRSESAPGEAARGEAARGEAARGEVARGAGVAGRVESARGEVRGAAARGDDTSGLPVLVDAFEQAQAATSAAETARLISEYGLPREAVKPEYLGEAEVWAALLERMPMTALIRNLATLTRVGVVAPGSYGAAYAVEQLGDTERLRKARVHPIAVLSALRTYALGQGVRGSHTWTPVATIVDALDAAFYAAFGNVEPANSRMLLALDVSGSMGWGEMAGVPGLTPRDASAAMALVTAATEPSYEIVAFSRGLTPLAISPRQRLGDAVQTVSGLPFDATDCAQPMLYALERKREIDTFVVYTDSETWCGQVHPVHALRRYRERTGIAARLVVIGMVANGFTIADPEDPGMLDIVGFDTATPDVVSGFARGVV